MLSPLESAVLCPLSSVKLHSQIRLSDSRVLQQLRGGTRLDDAAGLEHISAMCVLQRDLDILFDEQGGRAVPVDLGEEGEKLIDDEGSESERQLVDDEQPRPS